MLSYMLLIAETLYPLVQGLVFLSNLFMNTKWIILSYIHLVLKLLSAIQILILRNWIPVVWMLSFLVMECKPRVTLSGSLHSNESYLLVTLSFYLLHLVLS